PNRPRPITSTASVRLVRSTAPPHVGRAACATRRRTVYEPLGPQPSALVRISCRSFLAARRSTDDRALVGKADQTVAGAQSERRPSVIGPRRPTYMQATITYF